MCQPLYAAGDAIEDLGESGAVVLGCRRQLRCRRRFLTAPHVATGPNAVELPFANPTSELADPTHRERVRAAELAEEPARAREQILGLLVLGGLREEGVQIETGAPPPAICISVRQTTSGSSQTRAAARSQLSSAQRYHSESTRTTAWRGRRPTVAIPFCNNC